MEVGNKIIYIYALLRYYIKYCYDFVVSIFSKKQIIKFDNGKSVRIVRQIAEGGFSVVFEVMDMDVRKRYALKRVLCADAESIHKCREEAAVHSSFDHPNLLPLLGIKFEKHNDFEFCYLLFPFLCKSLREDIKSRHILSTTQEDCIKAKPYKDIELLEIFSGIVDATLALHDKNLAHRDIKVENVMIHPVTNAPILIDYGSVGPLHLAVHTRNDILSITDASAMNSTVSYRAPELFDGGTPHGTHEPNIDGRTDVWSLGCVLFALMYGISPFECEFSKNGNTIRVVECSQLRVLGNTPYPIPKSPLDKRYNAHFPELHHFIDYMLTQDRLLRPNIDQVVDRLDVLLKKVGGTWRWRYIENDERDAFVTFV